MKNELFGYVVRYFLSLISQLTYILTHFKNDFYGGLFSTKQMAEIIERNPIRFGVNLDVTSWSKEEGRQTHNLPGRAHPAQGNTTVSTVYIITLIFMSNFLQIHYPNI